MRTNNVDRWVREAVQIDAGDQCLHGNLCIPPHAKGLIAFVHGSGSSRFSTRNLFVAEFLNERGFATLLFDLLSSSEEQIDNLTARYRFDISLLSRRVLHATEWIQNDQRTKQLSIGYFGASTGAAAALVSASRLGAAVKAVVSRGGRPDLASGYLSGVTCPTLFLVGERDSEVLKLNLKTLSLLPETTVKEIEIVPDATHLFEEPGALAVVANAAARWFKAYLSGKKNGS
ncbi:MAG: alpha/beta hydrolase [Candidatus Melainabacteria bacterium]|nr:MAG: alpha/beta hydrolase [Candidatus Melainabacteria bacterium]